MKRTLVVLTLVVVLAMSVTALASCGSDKKDVKLETVEFFPDNFVAVDYSNMTEVKDMDAFELVCKVYDTWTNDKGYMRDQYFSFKAEPVGTPLTNFTHDVYKIDGDRLYKRMVVIQDSEPFKSNRYEVSRFYFDGTNCQRVVFDDAKDKTIIPGDAKHEKGLFYVAEEPAMKPFNGDDEGSVADMMKTYTSHMTTYEWRDKANLVMDNFKVYRAKDNTLRCTMTIDCSEEMMSNAHLEAKKEFASSTGAKLDTLKLKNNTTLDFVIGEVNGVNKILAWRRTEVYQGIAKDVPVPVPAKQTCVETFSYDEADYKITAEDIA